MKLFFTLLLPFVAKGAAIQLEERQLGASGSASGLTGSFTSALSNLMYSKKKAFKTEEMPSKFPGAKRIKMTWGPYKLKGAKSTAKVGNGMSMDRGGTGYQYLVDDDFPKDATVLETEAYVVTENFKRAETTDGIYTHHLAFFDYASAPASAYGCTGGKTPMNFPISVFMGGSTEVGPQTYAAAKGAVKSGYYLTKDRVILNTMDVVNYNDEEKNVYVSGEIEYLPGKLAGYSDARQERVDPGMCGGQSGARILPPKGVRKFSVNSTGIIATRDGHIVNMKGHVHDGGVDVLMKINDKVVCNSKALYGGEGHTSKTADGKVWETIRTTSMCDEPVRVAKGDKIYMEAHYDLELHPPREQGHGGMGMRRRDVETMGGVDAATDAAEAEQMALFITHFAYLEGSA